MFALDGTKIYYVKVQEEIKKFKKKKKKRSTFRDISLKNARNHFLAQALRS